MKRQPDLFPIAELDPDRSLQDEAWFPLLVGAMLTVGNQWSPNTRNAYQYGIRSWHDFAREYGEETSMPPRPQAVVAWLEYLATTKKMARSSIYLRLSGLAWADRWARSEANNDPYSLLAHPLIKAWKRGHRRATVARVLDTSPPTQLELKRLVNACLKRRAGRGPYRTPILMARDRALILMMYYGAMRKGELCALRVCDVETTFRGLEITFRRSKTDQEGEGEMRAIFAQEELLMCPVHAWRAWLDLYKPASSRMPAFQSMKRGCYEITGRALGYEAINKILLIRCKEAGIRRISAHHLRSAFATHAAEKNDEGEIAFHGRWKSRSTMDRYIRRGKTWKKNPTVGLMSGS